MAILLASVAGLFALSSKGDDLVVNGSFENYTGTIPDNGYAYVPDPIVLEGWTADVSEAGSNIGLSSTNDTRI